MMLAILALAAATQDRAASEGVEMSVRLAPGVRVPYTLEVNSSTKLRHGAETFESTTAGEQEFELEALETAADGTTSFAIRFGKAKGTAKLDGSSDPFDSEKPSSKRLHPILDGDPIAMGMLRRAGKTVRAKVTAKGRVEKVEGLAELYAGMKELEGIPVEHEIQELFARLPEVAIAARTKWTGAYSFTPSKDETVEFAPDCAVSKVAAEAIAWSIKSPAIGSPASKSKRPRSGSRDAPPRGSTEGEKWKSASWAIEAAAISGSTQIAPGDGLLLRQSIDWGFEVVYGELETDSRTLSRSVRRRVEVVRR